MAIRVGILNVTGYAGVELARLLCQHPKVKLASVTGRSTVGQPLNHIFPHLGSTSLTVVAPGIAEALIATAAGLAAAIPAVYFYNHLNNRVKLYLSAMDDFCLEFLSIAERNFT